MAESIITGTIYKTRQDSRTRIVVCATYYVKWERKKIKIRNVQSFSLYKSMGAIEPWGVANLDPRGMVGRIYVGDHLTLLHTKYLSSGPYGFREEDF